jgi:type I restriction enzyme R subunit
LTGNFDFLRAEWPELNASARNAERDALFDARTTCFYARRTLESAVKWLYAVNSVPVPYKDDLSARLHDPAFKALVPPQLLPKMHLIRKRGNHAVHDEHPIHRDTGLAVLGELFHVMSWLARTYASQPASRPTAGAQFDPQRLPKPGGGPGVAKTMGQLKALNEQVAGKDAELEEATKQRASLMEQLTARDAQLKAADTRRSDRRVESPSSASQGSSCCSSGHP